MGNGSVRVIIPVCGDISYWMPLAERAYNSVKKSENVYVQVSLDETLQKARNNSAMVTKFDWIIFLDADDALDENYIDEMLKNCDGYDIIAPTVHRHYEDGSVNKEQYWFSPIDLMTRNWIVIGALVRASLFKEVGGFRDFPALEDYDMWLRMEEAGAKIKKCDTAIYNIHVREGRNSNQEIQKQMFDQILSEAKQRRGII